MIEFLAFTWLLSRHTWREREESDGLLFALFLVPVVITVLFAYMIYIGLEDVGTGWLVRWAATLAAAGTVVLAAWDGRWLVALGGAFGIGLVGLLLVLMAGLLRAKVKHEKEPDESGPRWRFS